MNGPLGWMSRWPSRVSGGLIALGAVFMLLLPKSALAAGGGPVTKIINVADTRTLAPGLGKWIADVYNDDLVLFGIMVVVVMAVMGGTLGFFFDRIIGLVGINLGKLDHHE